MMDQQSKRIAHDGTIQQELERGQIAAAVIDGSMKGILVLPVNDSLIQVKSYQDSFAIDNLLADTNNPMRLFPSWIVYDVEKDYLSYNEKVFCDAFVNFNKLTQKKGRFYSNGKHIAMSEIEQMIYVCLSIVTNKAGEKKRSVINALKVVCPDETPEEASESNRLTIKALRAEMEQRGYGIRLNKITMRQEPIGKTESGRIMAVKDLRVVLHDALSDDYKGVTHETLKQYISFLARENQYNPVIDLLKATKWDMTDRLGQLYGIIGIKQEDRLSKTLVFKWLLQSVALLFNDEKNPFGADGALVFNGPQGMGKTSVFRHLAMQSEWFGEGKRLSDFDKDFERRVLTTWICELGEVESTFKKADVDNLKNFVTAPRDQYRLPYDSEDTEAPRHTSLCATCNSERYLIDATGNRRWWSVPFRTDYLPYNELEKLDALQLWAQIYHGFIEGMSPDELRKCFRLTPTEQQELAARNGAYEAPLKAQSEIEDILYKQNHEGLPTKEMPISDFIKKEWPEYLSKYDSRQVCAVLKRLGISTEKKRVGTVATLPCSRRAPVY